MFKSDKSSEKLNVYNRPEITLRSARETPNPVNGEQTKNCKC